MHTERDRSHCYCLVAELCIKADGSHSTLEHRRSSPIAFGLGKDESVQ